MSSSDQNSSGKNLSVSQQRWETEVRAKYVQTHPERRVAFRNDVGLDIQPLYTPLDLEKRGFDYERDLGFPGEFPFTRGVNPSMNRGELFNIRVYSGFGNAERCNDRYKKIAAWGADELQIAADLPTQIGYDSDHIMSRGEIGRTGVAIDSLQDMEILFAGLPLNRFKRVSTLFNSIGPIALSLFIALGEKQGLKPSDFVLDLQNDPLKEYVARGTYIFPMPDAVRFACDAVEYCAKHAPHWYPMTLCVNHMNAAGGGSTKATAFAMANGIEYINELLRRGLCIDQIAPLLDMFLDEREDFFVTTANCRAARKIWAHLMRDRFGAKDPRSMAMKFTSYAHGGETLKEPINNIVRIAFASLAYAFGGVQFLYDASWDEPMATPSDEACKVAIRTLQIIGHELGLSKTVDPLAGSYYLESLTLDIERDIRAEFANVEKQGGAVSAISKGYYQGIITKGAVRRQQEFEKGQRVSVGVNLFPSDEDLPLGAFRVDPAIEQQQLQRLKALKESRNNKLVSGALGDIREAAVARQNLVEPVLAAVKAYTTVGEICDTLRGVYGEHKVITQF
jgi:methylmalonyl-CoA mutase N-terminal domain/subunit